MVAIPSRPTAIPKPAIWTSCSTWSNGCGEITGKPVGIKTAIGGWQFMHELVEAVNAGPARRPDFLAIDGGEGGSGAAPGPGRPHGPVHPGSPAAGGGQPHRIRVARAHPVIAAGKLVTRQGRLGARLRRRFRQYGPGLHVLPGLHQAPRCHQNTCPTGITTTTRACSAALVVEDKAERVAAYCRNMNKEIDMIAHSCGLKHAGSSAGEHVRIMQISGQRRGP